MATETKEQDLKNRIDYVFEVMNLLESNKLIPEIVTECAKNRVLISRYKEDVKSQSNEEQLKVVEEKLAKCQGREIKFQQMLSKSYKPSIFKRIFSKFRE
jgi:hypothetical protein